MNLNTRRSSLENSEPSTVEEKIVKVNGDLAFRRYTKGRFLGKGGFARVYEMTCIETKTVNAAKVISKATLSKARTRQKLMSEIKIHRSLHHCHVVLFEHFFEDSENVYILLELCQNQTLSELMRRRKRITELEAQCYSYQVISALRYLHEHHVIHRDIKLGNLFLNEKMEVKVGDFGLAAKLEFEGERKRTICGTPNYLAPEILDGKQGHSYEVDVWSFGVLLYTFVVGKPPFETNDVKITYRRIKMNAYSFPDHINLSPDVKNLISSILISEPNLRPTFEQVLSHPFFATPFPKQMPASTLAVPPAPALLKQYARPEAIKVSLTEIEPMSPISPKARAQEHPENKFAESQKRTSSGTKRVANISSYNPPAEFQGAAIWVKKWVDYSTKYGLGYLMSNNSVGVYFNDSTKIVSAADGQSFQYFHRVGPNREEQVEAHSMGGYPAELKKKVTLLEHFRKHLTSEQRENGAEIVYIKKWMATSHAFIFRLSNKMVQVSFQDRTEILVCSNLKQVTYVNKMGEPLVYPLKTAAESGNVEMSKRLRYTKEILTGMLQGGKGEGLLSNR